MNKEQFMRVVSVVAELVEKKGQDYNEGDVHVYFPFHHKSYVQMLWVKMMRILHVTRKQEEGKPLNFESAEDSIIDLIAYSVFYLEYLQKQKKPEQDYPKQGRALTPEEFERAMNDVRRETIASAPVDRRERRP